MITVCEGVIGPANGAKPRDILANSQSDGDGFSRHNDDNYN